MTNPADILTDEFIERVAERTRGRVISLGWRRTYDGIETERMFLGSLSAVLAEEREPVQTVTFEVRADSSGAALAKLTNALSSPGSFYARSDIRLVEPT